MMATFAPTIKEESLSETLLSHITPAFGISTTAVSITDGNERAETATPESDIANVPPRYPDITMKCAKCCEFIDMRLLQEHRRYHEALETLGFEPNDRPTLLQQLVAKRAATQQELPPEDDSVYKLQQFTKLDNAFELLRTDLEGTHARDHRLIERTHVHDARGQAQSVSAECILAIGKCAVANERWKRLMEDAHVVRDTFGGDTRKCFIALYDGHHGDRAARTAAHQLHHALLHEMEKFDVRTRNGATTGDGNIAPDRVIISQHMTDEHKDEERDAEGKEVRLLGAKGEDCVSKVNEKYENSVKASKGDVTDPNAFGKVTSSLDKADDGPLIKLRTHFAGNDKSELTEGIDKSPADNAIDPTDVFRAVSTGIVQRIISLCEDHMRYMGENSENILYRKLYKPKPTPRHNCKAKKAKQTQDNADIVEKKLKKIKKKRKRKRRNPFDVKMCAALDRAHKYTDMALSLGRDEPSRVRWSGCSTICCVFRDIPEGEGNQREPQTMSSEDTDNASSEEQEYEVTSGYLVDPPSIILSEPVEDIDIPYHDENKDANNELIMDNASNRGNGIQVGANNDSIKEGDGNDSSKKGDGNASRKDDNEYESRKEDKGDSEPRKADNESGKDEKEPGIDFDKSSEGDNVPLITEKASREAGAELPMGENKSGEDGNESRKDDVESRKTDAESREPDKESREYDDESREYDDETRKGDNGPRKDYSESSKMDSVSRKDDNESRMDGNVLRKTVTESQEYESESTSDSISSSSSSSISSIDDANNLPRIDITDASRTDVTNKSRVDVVPKFLGSDDADNESRNCRADNGSPDGVFENLSCYLSSYGDANKSSHIILTAKSIHDDNTDNTSRNCRAGNVSPEGVTHDDDDTGNTSLIYGTNCDPGNASRFDDSSDNSLRNVDADNASRNDEDALRDDGDAVHDGGDAVRGDSADKNEDGEEKDTTDNKSQPDVREERKQSKEPLVQLGVINIANAGNIHAILIRGNKPYQLTKNHTLRNPKERRRVIREGAYFCESDRELRINGVLEATRGLGNHGDVGLKRCVITDPYTTSVKIDQHAQILLLASHGVWEIFSPEEVTYLLVQMLPRNRVKRPARYASDVHLVEVSITPVGDIFDEPAAPADALTLDAENSKLVASSLPAIIPGDNSGDNIRVSGRASLKSSPACFSYKDPGDRRQSALKYIPSAVEPRRTSDGLHVQMGSNSHESSQKTLSRQPTYASVSSTAGSITVDERCLARDMARRMAERLAQAALLAGAKDNVTVIVVLLPGSNILSASQTDIDNMGVN